MPPNITPVSENKGKKDPFKKDSQIVIIGAGPAGMHMGSMLRRHGFTNIKVLEKEARHGGKTHTVFLEETGKVPHEMGTCYLHAGYKRIKGYMNNYLGKDYYIRPGYPQFLDFDVFAPDLDRSQMRPEENIGKPWRPSQWLFREEGNRWCARKLTEAQIFAVVADIFRYDELHKRLLGDNHYGLPPRPSAEFFEKELNMSFEELLKKHKLESILDISTLGSGSFGFPFNVPALYGMAWMSPIFTSSYIWSKISHQGYGLVTSGGYQRLWDTMVEKEGLEIILECNIKSINRHLDDPAAQVDIEYEKDGATQTLKADFVIWAAPQKETMHLFSDLVEKEREIFSSLKTVGLITTIYKSDARTTWRKNGLPDWTWIESPLSFFPESLSPSKPEGVLYNERDSAKAHRPMDPYPGRYCMGYQYYDNYDPNRNEQAAKDLVEFVAGYGVRNPQIIKQKNYDYFPRFTNEFLAKLYPWEILDMQGNHKTWYAGSSCWYESVEDVVNYNEMLMRLFLGVDLEKDIASVID